MRYRLRLLSGLIALAATAVAAAQSQPLEQILVPMRLDSGPVVNSGSQRAVIFSQVLRAADAPWVRLQFEEASLGAAPEGGEPTLLRLTAIEDGAQQRMQATHLVQWRYTSAYFNGDAVLVEIIADPGAAPSEISVAEIWAGSPLPPQTGERAICDGVDDRQLSDDPRNARLMPVGCTGWLINDANRTFLTAGHCSYATDVAQFNVPLSDPNGSVNHPGPEDQYPVDPVSMQSNGGLGTGNDWAYFGCFPNSNTALTPFEAQGETYILAAQAPAVDGQNIRITGFGSTSSPAPGEWDQVQKTHVGPYWELTGTTLRYRTDTTGGNSGSPVIDESTGMAIGIHTHAGCGSGGSGANHGTAVDHSGLQNALANPQGVCIPNPPVTFVYPDGRPDNFAPAGQTIRVEVHDTDEGGPIGASGMVHFEIDGAITSLPMSEVAPNIYDAVFPAYDCGESITYWFTVDATDGETVSDPYNAPGNAFGAIAADDLIFAFADNFETHQAWSAGGTAIDGQWNRGVPVGGGDRGDAPTDADGSGQCYLTDNVDGNSDVDNGTAVLTSPAMNTTSGQTFLSYYRWYSNDNGASPNSDTFVVQFSTDNGSSWNPLETVGPTGPGTAGGWFHLEWDLNAFTGFTPSAEFRIRFIAADEGAGSVIEAAVDGVTLSATPGGIVCNPCPADLTGDQQVNVFDLLDLLGAWGECDACPADLTGDDTVNVFDLLDLLGAWGDCG